MKSRDIDTKQAKNLVSEHTVIKGDIKAGGDFRIDGNLEGTIEVERRLVIGGTGVIKGEISAADMEISGKVEGRLKVKNMLSIKGTAKIDGDVHTGRLTVEPGAIFNAQCTMGTSTESTSKEK